MFDEKIKYKNSKDVDLMQAVNESMIEMTYEAQNLDFIISIVKIDSNEKKATQETSDIDVRVLAKTHIDVKKSEDESLNKNKASEYLLTSSYTTETISDSSINNSSIEKSSFKVKKMMKLDLNKTNILSEKMSRSRRRKQAYSTALSQMKNQNSDDAFHEAFASVFMTNTKSERIHRDDLLDESRHYHQMIKHSHADDFKQIMQIELKALTERNI